MSTWPSTSTRSRSRGDGMPPSMACTATPIVITTIVSSFNTFCKLPWTQNRRSHPYKTVTPGGLSLGTVYPSRKLRRFESFTCHHVMKGLLTCGNAGQGPFVWSGCDGVNRLSTAFAGNTWGSFGNVRHFDSRGQRQRRLDARLRDIFLAMVALAWTLRRTFTLGSAPRRPGSVGPRHSAKAKRPRGAGRTGAWPAARRTRYRRERQHRPQPRLDRWCPCSGA